MGPRRRATRFTSAASVRVRVLAAVLLVAMLGMALTGAVIFAVQFARVSAAIDDALNQEVAEFQKLATDGLDPATGRPFESVAALLTTFLQRNVPDRNETFLTMLDGRPFQVAGVERALRLEEEPGVVAAVDAAQALGEITLQDIGTAAGPARVVVVPVGDGAAGQTGALVIGFAVEPERAALMRSIRTYLVAAAASLLLVGMVGWLVAGRLLQPLRTLREAAARLEAGELSERIPVQGNDDITALTTAYNDMLDRLEAAFDDQRRFLDDAGHELRTPLTVLRGHLELLDPADPEDVSATRELLVDEIDRMSRLVEDLIVLSKSRRPDFLVTGSIEADEFLNAMLDRVRAIDSHTWAAESGGPGVFQGDRQRLMQAMLELATNAAKYSKPGSQITLSVLLCPGEVWLGVNDEGRGIAEADLPRIFERFRRAEVGRGVEGSGLGLSIVAAIVEAHSGRIDVASEVGAGSTFTLVLPRHGASGPVPQPGARHAAPRARAGVAG